MIRPCASTPFSEALLAARAGAPPGLHAWNGSDPTQRFDVYRNNVLVSLSSALATAFPVCCQLLGDEFFLAMAREYVRLSPPVSPVIAEYGDGFADFIEAFPPAATLPYLPDVARLERLRVLSYHAADASLLDSGSLQGLLADPESLGQLQIQLHPACHVMRSRHAIVSLWAAHQTGSETERRSALSCIDLDSAEDALVTRPAHDVSVSRLPWGAAEFLLALAAGQGLGQAARAAAQVDGSNLETNMAWLLRPGVAQPLAGV